MGTKNKLEDYKPGSTKKQVHSALRKVALFKPKKKQNPDLQSDKASY